MKIKLFALFSVIIFLFHALPAQEIKVDTTYHTKGTTEVLVYTREKNSTRSTLAHKGHDKNIVKVGLLNFITGVIPVYYERQLTDYLTLQAGVGLTTRDFVADLRNIIGELGTGSNVYYSYEHRKALVGFYLAFQPKFYVQSDAMDGFFISPMFEYKRYNYKANMIVEGQTEMIYLANTYQPEHRDALDFTINFGWQWMYNPLVVEIYGGVGFRKFYETRQDIQLNDFTNTYTNGVRSFDGFRPEFNLYLNFGGFF